MGKQDTQDAVAAQGSQTATPPATPAPAPDPVAELQRKVEQLEKQTADKDKYITDLKTTVETVEARLNNTRSTPSADVPDDIQQEVKQIGEKFTLDAEGATSDLVNFVKRTNEKTKNEVLASMRPVIEETLYIEKVKIDNKEVVEFFGEDYLYVKGAQLFQAGKVKTAREAVDAVIKEAKEKLGKVQTNPQPLQTPPQAMGEAGANVAPAPTPPPKEITPEDELRSRHERRRQQGLE